MRLWHLVFILLLIEGLCAHPIIGILYAVGKVALPALVGLGISLIHKEPEPVAEQALRASIYLTQASNAQEIVKMNMMLARNSANQNDRMEQLERKLDQILEQTLRAVDRNALLSSTYSHSLSSGFLEQNYELADVIHGVTDWGDMTHQLLVNDFRKHALKELDEIAKLHGVGHKDLRDARKLIEKTINSSFAVVEKRLMDYYGDTTEGLMEIRDVSKGLCGHVKRSSVIEKITRGANETKRMIEESDWLIGQLKKIFIDQFIKSIKSSDLRRIPDPRFGEDIREFSGNISLQIKHLEEVIVQEFVELKGYHENVHLRDKILVPMNVTMEKMDNYIRDPSDSKLRIFYDAYNSNNPNAVATLISHSFKEKLETLMYGMEKIQRFNHTQIEELSQLLMVQYGLAQTVIIFHDVHMEKDAYEKEKIYKEHLNKWKLNLEHMRRIDREIRHKVAYFDFAINGPKYLKMVTDKLDLESSRDEIEDALNMINDQLSLHRWSDTDEPLNQYVVFSTQRCRNEIHQDEHSKNHLISYKNKHGLQFFIYRNQVDGLREIEYRGTHDFHIGINKRTLRGAITDRVSQVDLPNDQSFDMTSLWVYLRKETFQATVEACDKHCKVVLTTGSCLITSENPKNFAHFLGMFKQVQVFVGL